MRVKYYEDNDIAVYNDVQFRRDKNTGYYLSGAAIGQSRKRLHVYVWECERGSIPVGYEVHHIDKDKSHNDIENLELLLAEEHRKLHADEITQETREWRAKNVQEKAMPKAIEWHKSEEGREWHKKHHAQMSEVLYKKELLTCAYCGEEFEAVKRSKYCSNKCKSAARRASGIDDVVKICQKCGGEFIANKYQKTKYCPICKRGKR